MSKTLNQIESSIARRMILYVILASALISIFTSGFQIYSEYKRDMNKIHAGINQIENTHLYNITSRLWVLDMRELNITLNSLLSLPSIQYVAVYEDKKILLQAGDNITNKFIEKKYPLIYADGEEHILLGELIVKASLDNVYQQLIERATIIIVGNIIKTLLVASLIMLIFYHLVAKHIIKIARYTENFDIDNIDESFSFDRKPNNRLDELDILRNSVLRMRKNLVKSTTSLKTREKEQSEILNTMSDAVISIDDKGVILSFNRAAEVMFGYISNEVIGQNVKLLMPDEFAKKHDAHLQNYRTENASKVIGLGRDVTGMRKNKSSLHLRLFVSKLPRDIKGRKRFIGTLVDLTNFKNQEEQLRRSQKMDALGKLTGGIAHDFNNLLSIIMGYSDLLKNISNDESEIQYANEIYRAGDRGIELTKKLLSFSKANTYNATELDVNALLQNQKDMLEKIVTVRIKLDFSLDRNLWLVYLDAGDLEDTIINLCINSMHAMQSMQNGAYLQISTSNQTLDIDEAKFLNLKPGSYIKISISDNGKGMDTKTKDLIFDPFFTTKGPDGTGLGLTQVFGFVKRSKGAIEVQSKQNKGTTFSLYFPRYFTKYIKIQKTPKDKKTQGGNESILVVDDELSLRELTQEMLSVQGYKVVCADNGESAIKILENHSIDLIVSDIIMPEMDGYQLSEFVQTTYPHIKIILVSGYSDKFQLLHTDEKFNHNLLRKPYDFNDLFQRIRELLDVNTKNDFIDYKLTVDENNQILPIVWDDNFDTKIVEMDKDHKEYVTLVNLCIEIANDNKKIGRMDDILQELLNHSIQHFQREEEFLATNNYLLLERHKKVHQIFIDYINSYINDLNHQKLCVRKLVDFLVAWLNEHMLGMDKMSSNYFQQDNKENH